MQLLLWAGSRAARVKSHSKWHTSPLNYCSIFTVHIKFTNAAGGQPGGQRVVHQWFGWMPVLKESSSRAKYSGTNKMAPVTKQLYTYNVTSDIPVIETGTILWRRHTKHNRPRTDILSSVTGQTKQEVTENEGERRDSKRKIKWPASCRRIC